MINFIALKNSIWTFLHWMQTKSSLKRITYWIYTGCKKHITKNKFCMIIIILLQNNNKTILISCNSFSCRPLSMSRGPPEFSRSVCPVPRSEFRRNVGKLWREYSVHSQYVSANNIGTKWLKWNLMYVI